MLETEVSNKVATRLYEDRLGFLREELLVRHFLNRGDAHRLRLWFLQTLDSRTMIFSSFIAVTWKHHKTTIRETYA